MGRHKFGWHSGKVTCQDIVVNDTMTVHGNLAFGNASTDKLAVTGTMTVAETTTASLVGLDITQTGTGKTVRIDQNATGAAANYALEIDDESTGATSAVYVGALKTGPVVTIAQESTTGLNAVGLFINQDSTTATSYAVNIDAETTGAIFNIAAAATTVPLFALDASSFQAIAGTTAATERIVVKTGTNLRYINLYSA